MDSKKNTAFYKNGTICPTNSLYAAGATFLLIGLLFFACCCTSRAPDYVYTRGFQEKICTVHGHSWHSDVCCQSQVKDLEKCETGYNYPCLVINISYVDSGNEAFATLYDSYHSMTAASPIDKCSYFHCNSNKYSRHKKDAKQFLRKYGEEGDKHKCYINPKKPKETTAEKASSATLIILLMISGPLILAGIAFCVVTSLLDALHIKEKGSLVEGLENSFEGEQLAVEQDKPRGLANNKVAPEPEIQIIVNDGLQELPQQNHKPMAVGKPLGTLSLRTSKKTTTTDNYSKSRSKSRPVSNSTMTVEIDDYNANDESPSFRAREPAKPRPVVPGILDQTGTEGVEEDVCGATDEDELISDRPATDKKGKKKRKRKKMDNS